MKPLHNFQESVYKKARQQTKQAVGSISLATVVWASNEHSAFERYKRALADQVMLAYRDVSKRLCFYTDASDTL